MFKIFRHQQDIDILGHSFVVMGVQGHSPHDCVRDFGSLQPPDQPLQGLVGFPATLEEKVGFHEEGLARQYLRINGVWHDHLLFALL